MKYTQHYCHNCGQWRDLVYLYLCATCAGSMWGVTHHSTADGTPAIEG